MKNSNEKPMVFPIEKLNTSVYLYIETNDKGELSITYDVDEKLFEQYSEEYVTSEIEKELQKALNNRGIN